MKLIFSLYLSANEANHNKDYSVVNTSGSLVLQRGIFLSDLVYKKEPEALAGGFRFLFLFVAIGSVDVATFPLLVLQVEEQPSAHGNEGYKGAHGDKYSVVCHN